MTTTSIIDSFPLEGCKPKLAHDGECLILMGVNIGGELLDIKIKRKNAQGQVITEDLDKEWPVDMIRLAAKIAQQIFKKSVFPEFNEKVLSYTNSDRKLFKVKNLKEGVEVDIKKQDVQKYLTTIHDLFFNSSFSGPVLNGSILKAKQVSQSKWLNGIELEEGVPLTKALEKSKADGMEELPEAGSTPQTLSYTATEPNEGTASKSATESSQTSESNEGTVSKSATKSSQTTQAKKSAANTSSGTAETLPSEEGEDQKDKQKLISGISTPLTESQKKEFPDHLKNLTYQQLHDYAQKKERERSQQDPAAQAYNSFLKLLRNPNDKTEQKMFEWLSIMYERTYEYYHQNIHDQLNDEDFAEWAFEKYGEKDPCKPYAAEDVLGFIRVEGQDFAQLAAKLVECVVIPDNI